MKKFKVKLTGVIIALIIIALLIPTKVLGAANEDLQIVKAEQDYIIYVKDLAKTEFDFAISEKPDADDIDLNYIKSVEDEDGNQVAFVTLEKYDNELKNNANNYIYIKTAEGVECKEINFEDAFDKEKMAEVETSTKRIATELVTDIVEKDEEVDGVKVKVTVGGLKITDSDKATYYYSMTKLPADTYTELMELAEKINAEYNTMDMYTRIETAKQFYNLYHELEAQQNWVEVENMTIMQPNDAQKGEQYVVYLKKVDENGTETVDVKLMTSYREDEEEKIPGRTETRVVQETAKLPITGDSIVLFVILAVIILVAIIVFIRMRKLQNKESKH